MSNLIRQAWDSVRGLWGSPEDAIAEIEKERFGNKGQNPYFYPPMDGGSKYDPYMRFTELSHTRLGRYRDYEAMDDYPETSSALDMYADEATQIDFLGRYSRMWVESKNANISSDLNFLLAEQLKTDSFVWELARYMCKYGDNYERLFVNQNGVVGTEPLPSPATIRVDDNNGRLMGFMVSLSADFSVDSERFRAMIGSRDKDWQRSFRSYHAAGSQAFAFEDWEVSHFRLRGKDRMNDYGYSILEPARWLFKRLLMMEDSAIIHKITRAPSRNVFYVDVGMVSPQQAMQHVNKVKDYYKRKTISKRSNNAFDMVYAPLSMDEDIFIPVHRERGESVRVDTLSGSDYQPMEDVDYFRKKLGRALKIPLFGRDDDVMDKPLSQEDFRFAGAVMRVQGAVIAGFDKIMRVHLAATGRDPYDHAHSFSLHMPIPSAILELARIEVLNAKADIMSSLGEFISVRWMLVNYMGFSELEATDLMVKRQEEIDMQAAAELEREIEGVRIKREAGMEESIAPDYVQFVKTTSKAGKGAFGITEEKYNSGMDRKTMTRDDFRRKVRAKKRDDVLVRLDRIESMLSEIRTASGRFANANRPSYDQWQKTGQSR